MPPHQTLLRRAFERLARAWVQILQGLAGHWRPSAAPIPVPVRTDRRLWLHGLERD
jgi:hypothetical protein